MTRHPEVVRLVEEIVEKKSRDLARYETIKRFVILPHDLPQAANENTPTLKMPRRIVSAKYGHLLEGLYD